MTCIVGVIENDSVLLGGDSAGVDTNYGLEIRKEDKVFRNGEFVIGYTSSFRMGQLLRFKFVPPPHNIAGMDALEYMVAHFVEGIRECLKAGGFAEKRQEQECGGTFLVGYRSRLFAIYNDYQVCETKNSFHAVGGGAQIALGAMYAASSSLPAVARAAIALEAAEAFNAGVRRPFTFVWSNNEPNSKRMPNFSGH